jgi:hypothetical protein
MVEIKQETAYEHDRKEFNEDSIVSLPEGAIILQGGSFAIGRGFYIDYLVPVKKEVKPEVKA